MLLLAAACVACGLLAGLPLRLASAERRTSQVLTEVGGRVIRLPAHRLGTSAHWRGVATPTYRLETATPWAGGGVVAGMSGSPVLDESGAVVGAVAAQLFEGHSPVFCVTPISWITASWRRVRTPRKQATDTEMLSAASRVTAGSSIVLLDVWGDLLVGSQGTVTARDGDELAVMGHPVDGQGWTMRAVALAPVSANDEDPRRPRKTWSVGAMIGTAYYCSASGLFVRLGESPPSFSLTLKHKGPGDSKGRTRSCSVTADPARTHAALTECFRSAIQPDPATFEPGTWVVDLSVAGSMRVRGRDVVVTGYFDGPASLATITAGLIPQDGRAIEPVEISVEFVASSAGGGR